MKIEYLPTLIAISPYLEAEFDYGSTILHKKFQVISSKNEGGMVIFPNFDLKWNRKNRRHAFIFAWNDLKFFV